MKSIKTFGHGWTVARVYRDSEWNEYRVRILNNGHPLPALDYHTGDKADALDTAKSMLARILGPARSHDHLIRRQHENLLCENQTQCYGYCVHRTRTGKLSCRR